MEARKLPAEKLSAGGGGALDRFWPVMDGYVIASDQYKLYKAGKYNDTPALIGTNSNEGAIWVHSTTAEAYTAYLKKGFGPFADRILAAYPADSGEQALQSATRRMAGNRLCVGYLVLGAPSISNWEGPGVRLLFQPPATLP